MLATNRIWVIAGSLIIVAIVALAGLLGVKPQLDAAKASDDERASVELLNAQHRTDLESLKTDFARLPEVTAEVAGLRNAVPGTIDLDSVIAELAALQAGNGVRITNYSSIAPVPFVPSAVVIPSVPPTVNASNFLTTEIQLSMTGAPAAVMNFVNALQSSSRLYFVTDIAVGPKGENTLTVLVYTLLDEPLLDPAAVVEPLAPDVDAAE